MVQCQLSIGKEKGTLMNLARYQAQQRAADLVEEQMRTRNFLKTREYYLIDKPGPCEDHWIVLASSSLDGSTMDFGCLACGYRESWEAQD